MLARGYFNYWTDEDQLWKRNSNMEDRIQAQHDWLGWGFGCLLWLQEHSNNRGLKWSAGSAPCTSGSWRGQGEFTDFEHNGKKKQNHTTLRPHKPQMRSLTGPSQAKLSGRALCPHTTGSPWCHCSFWIWNRNRTEFLTFYPKDNWRYKLRYSCGKKTAEQVLSPLQWESAFCVHQSWNLLIMVITKHQSRSFSGRKSQPIFYHLRFSSLEIPLVWVPISVWLRAFVKIWLFF